MRRVEADFQFDIGEFVEVTHSVGFTHFGTGSVGKIVTRVVRQTSAGINRFYVLAGSTEEIPVLCVRKWRHANV